MLIHLEDFKTIILSCIHFVYQNVAIFTIHS